MNPLVNKMKFLYVGNLDKSATEDDLKDVFKVPTENVKMGTNKSEKYAYVHFEKYEDALEALETLNYHFLKGKFMRLLWSRRENRFQYSGNGDVFVSNLSPSMDSNSLYETFSIYGNILSCNVVTDGMSNCVGHGLIKFADENSAKSAINGDSSYEGRRITVVPLYQRGQSRVNLYDAFPHICVKNLNENVDNDKLYDMFKLYGIVLKHKVIVDHQGQSRCFGFVCFDCPKSASKAKRDMNNRLFEGRKLQVVPSLTRLELKSSLRLQVLRDSPVLLCVKNLTIDVNGGSLGREFLKYGVVLSAEVVKANGVSRGFGFVCFQATKKAVMTKVPNIRSFYFGTFLYVDWAQKKRNNN
ncbi:hypothetical protein CHUAL_002829 [Chamberlinius hualienensis]